MLQQRTESLSCADRLQQAMQYSLLSPGKRLRAALVYATGACLGLNITALDDLAAAIEAVHAYSLIHDDLPAMDDDDTRRGQPSCHRKFDEATAILAGDALHSQAMQWITDSQHLNCNQKLNALRILLNASGANGMIAGQAMEFDHTQQTNTKQIAKLKTGQLIVAAVSLGAIAAQADSDISAQLACFAELIGLGFQMRDDVLDQHAKNVADTEAELRNIAEQAYAILKKLPFETDQLKILTDLMLFRET